MHAAQAGTAFALVCGAILVLAPGRALFDNEFPASIVAFVLGQVAFVAGGLTLVRAWRSRRAGGPRGARLELILRGTFVVLACALAGVFDAAAHAVSSGAGWGASAWAPFAVLVLGAALTGTTAARARRRAIAVPPSTDPTGEDIESDPARRRATGPMARPARLIPGDLPSSSRSPPASRWRAGTASPTAPSASTTSAGSSTPPACC